LYVNTQDDNPYRNHHYITPFGSSIGIGEEGVVGRGNNALGVISTYRPYSMEAPFGKNPTYHTGRIYGVLSTEIAKLIYNTSNCRNEITILAQNGGTLLPPFVINIGLNDNRDEVFLTRKVSNFVREYDYLSAILEGYLVPTSW
jgi:S-adenosylmethionine synthetase